MENNQPSSNGGQQQGQQIQVKATDAVLAGLYANMLQVSHTKEEFVLDFMNLFPPTGILGSRVIVSPEHMKRIMLALEDNLKKYEEQFGKIEAGQNPQQSYGFRTE